MQFIWHIRNSTIYPLWGDQCGPEKYGTKDGTKIWSKDEIMEQIKRSESPGCGTL